jgi:hypothetical protein
MQGKAKIKIKKKIRINKNGVDILIKIARYY